MLYRIIMNVITVPFIISFIMDCVFPEPSLPDTFFTFFQHRLRHVACDGTLISLTEARFDVFPPDREIGIVFRQCPDSVKMLRQNYPGVYS